MQIPPERQQLIYSCQACYAGQVWQLSLNLPRSRVPHDAALAELVEAFHQLHATIYTVRSDTDPIEISEWNVQAIGLLPDVEVPALKASGRDQAPTPSSHRTAFLPEMRRAIDIPVYQGDLLPIECDVEGPAIIDDRLTSLLVNPGARARLTRFGSYVVELEV